DPVAQAALCRAVQLTEDPAGLGVVRPDPRYRQQVEQRLRRSRRRRRASHARLALGGVGIAVLSLILTLAWPTKTPPVPISHHLEQTQELAVRPRADVELEIARRWADLSVPADSHLARTHQEFVRRHPESTRKRDLASRGTASPVRKHL